MSENTVYLTEEGLEKLREELKFLKTTERQRIIAAIAEARSHGDLSENAEYDAAKEAQAMLESKIGELELTVRRARIVDESVIDSSKAYILSQVTVKNHNVGKDITYTLVSAQEADFTQKKISVDSPIGKALLGKSVGDVVEVTVPAGKLKLELLEITR
jgi:transcription elongation factor GreA